MDKDIIRTELLNSLSSLSFDEVKTISFDLTNQIIKLFHFLPELKEEIGAAYLPLKAEVAPIYQELLRKVPLNLAYPVLENGMMSFGIPQGLPKGGTWLEGPYHVVEPTWFFVPGVGFDLSGARLGRGKGYYDRYLENREEVLLIGLAWSEQIKQKIPVESHDCHMDFIITEKYCWDVGQQERI